MDHYEKHTHDIMLPLLDLVFLLLYPSVPLDTVKKASNHHANLPLEMYSFTLQPPGKHLETTGADDPTL